jgi:hypothetical protein
MSYNLTSSQKALMKEIVGLVRAKTIPEEFLVFWSSGRSQVVEAQSHKWESEPTRGRLEALEAADLIQIRRQQHGYNVSLLGAAYDAVDSDFNAPDTSFLTQLTPLADVTHLDEAIKQRVLPILSAGAGDSMLWDSAVRTAAVVLEERLRNVGGISDSSVIGKDLVNKVFSKTGSLASKFTNDSERDSYRDIYAGVVGLIRNPSAHRLIDPTPEEGGVSIVLIDLLLRKLEALR